MNKPRLTARIIRGLESVHALADVNQFEGSDLYVGCESEKEVREIDDAISWLGDLINWYHEKNGPPV